MQANRRDLLITLFLQCQTSTMTELKLCFKYQHLYITAECGILKSHQKKKIKKALVYENQIGQQLRDTPNACTHFMTD